MDIVKIPLGASASITISVSNGNVIATESVSAKPEIDALLQSVKAKLPASLQPLVDVAQAAIDAELAAP